MVLNSLAFAAFFLIFLGGLLLIPKRLRKFWLLAGNCAFYLSWERRMAVWIVVSALAVWGCALLAEKHGRKKIWLMIPVLWNVMLLAVFKFSGAAGAFFSRIGAGGLLTFRDLAAPLGISFYTLRCISYTAEVFRGNLAAVKNPADVLIYVSFFPQIISGPIERPGKFFTELSAFERKPLRNFEQIWQGFLLFCWGLFQKIVLAERLAAVTAAVFPHFESMGFAEILLGSIAYTLQIYCDFAGYSDMSQGIAAMMGFSTMRNFRQPYLAAGIKNFWRRWHISLTSWLTDYIYIPLGGSRRGQLRRYLNILIVFAVSGLWHGSTLNFLFWGLLHAAFQIAEDLWTRGGRRLPVWLMRIITLAEVNFAWIFFNSGGLNRGFRILRRMFTVYSFPESGLGLIPGNWVVLGLGLVILLVVDVLHERGVSIQKRVSALSMPLRWGLLLAFFWAIILLGIYGVGYDTAGFIYAKF